MMRLLKGIIFFGIITGIAIGCVQVGKLAGKLMTSSTDDLNEASTQIRYMRNIYPPEANTTEVGYFDNWEAGRNTIGINSFKRNGVGMLKIDGTVTANGDPLPYVDNGAYGKFLDNLEPQTVEIETVSGQKVSYQVGPVEAVRLTSVNGGSGEVDLGQDLVLEFDVPENSVHKNMRVMLLMKIMGARAWTDIAMIKESEKVVIPAETFKHLPTLGLQTGDSYLMVERYKVSPNTYEGIGAAQVLSLAYDTMPVHVSNKPKRLNGIRVEGEIEDEDGTISYTASKPNAFLGKPFSAGKTFALTSLTVRATKLKQSRTDVSTSTSYQTFGDTRYKVTTTTTKTETRKFPTLPEPFWDLFLNTMYEDVLATLNNNFGANFIPVETVVQAPSYKELEPIDDEITEVEVSKSYKGTKPLLPTTFAAIMSSISTTFASDRVDARLISELGVDGLVAVTVDLEMPWEEFSLSPRLSFRITGAPNGYIYGPTVYAEGIITGNGVELDEAKENTEIGLDLVNQIVRQPTLIDAFNRSLKELKAEEQKHSYEEIWALQE